MPLGPGQTLGGKYRLLRLLGDGGMGAVYEAEHERLGTHVAIKVIHPDVAQRPGIVDRFLQEARISAQIRSVHVAQVMDVDQTAEGLAYMVMELLTGETLLAVLEREKKLDVPRAADYTQQILEGLEAAHALGVVHRDLKPENVFITTDLTKKTIVKLIDFGIAKVKREDKNLTMAGITMGTAEYMAPEQAFSADQADARSDIYAVGVMFYEMLAGTRPVVGSDPRTIAMKVEAGTITPLVHAAPHVPGPIAGLVHRAMASRPNLRFPSAAEMRQAIATAVSGPIGPIQTPLPLDTTAPGAINPAFHAVPATTSTVREPAPAAAAFSPQPPSVVPGPGYVASQPPRSRPRKSGAFAIAFLVALPLVLGALVVLALVIRGDPEDLPMPPPPTTGTIVAADGAISTVTIDPLRPLSSTITPAQTYVAPPPVNVVKPPADAMAFPVADAGVPAVVDAGSTSPFPTIQFPFPHTDGGAVIPLPSFTFQIPGLPPPQH